MIVSIPFFVIVIVLVGFAMWFRSEIADLVAGVADVAVGAAGYTIDGLIAMWPAIRITVLISIAVAVGGWILLLIVMMTLGVYSHSTISALAISFLFPIWFVVFVMPPFISRIWIFGPMVRITRMICSPILLLATIFILVGLWSPTVKEGLDRWSDNSKQLLANSLNKKSLKSEKEAGVFGRITERTVAYDSTGAAMFDVASGVIVKITDLKGKEASRNSEGMIEVMLPNKYEDYVGKNIVFIPVRKINWNGV